MDSLIRQREDGYWCSKVTDAQWRVSEPFFAPFKGQHWCIVENDIEAKACIGFGSLTMAVSLLEEKGMQLIGAWPAKTEDVGETFEIVTQ